MHNSTTATTPITATISARVQILAAIMLGFAIMAGVGFSSLEVAHNAAHDTRHSFAFPCH
jgi:cobalt transporter subunit CbtB